MAKSHELALAVYKSTRTFPGEQRFGLTGQLRRASISIPTNIAEGCECGTDNELGRYLRISLGSAAEVEYQLLLAKELGHLSISDYEPLRLAVLEIQSMLAVLSRRLKWTRKRVPQLAEHD
jgi:four helix bundle protein